jgi:hypothetical protein
LKQAVYLDLGLLSECNTRVLLPPLTSSFLLEVVEATLENVNAMTLDLGQTQFLGVRLHTPTPTINKADDTTTPKSIKACREDRRPS